MAVSNHNRDGGSLAHVDAHPKWKAFCLKCIGKTLTEIGSYRSAIDYLGSALRLFAEFDMRSEIAWCKWSAVKPHEYLGEYDQAELLLGEARELHAETGEVNGEALCRMDLGGLMQMTHNRIAAIEHLSAA